MKEDIERLDKINQNFEDSIKYIEGQYFFVDTVLVDNITDKVENENYSKNKMVVDNTTDKVKDENYSKNKVPTNTSIFYKDDRYEHNDYSRQYEKNQKLSITKLMHNNWTKIIDSSINSGNHHFAITINFLNIDYISNYYKNPVDLEEVQGKLRFYLYDLFPTTSWLFIIFEKTKTNMLHLHAIIAIKNFIDYNQTIKNNLINCLLSFPSYSNENVDDDITNFDIKVQCLNYFKDIKNWVIYMHKDMYNWRYKGSLFFLAQNINEYFFEYRPSLSDIYFQFVCNDATNDGRPINIDILDKKRFNKYLFNIKYGGGILLNVRGGLLLNYIKTLNSVDVVLGVKLINNKIDQRVLINLLQYYLILNGYYLCGDNIYKKINESFISYTLIGNIESVLYDSFQENVVRFFITNFEYYFKGFDFNYLIVNYLIKSKTVIDSLKNIITNKIDPDFSLMEFTDGIYSIKYNNFITKKQLQENVKYLKKTTLKYYNKTFDWVNRRKPLNWISGVSRALNIKEDSVEFNENFLKIVKAFSLIFQEEKIKQSTLFVYGPSNSGKTTLITNHITNYLGSNNIGTVISAKNFKWQDLIGKIIGIIDEGRYNQSMSSDLLKISGRETIIVEKKYSKEHIEIKPLVLIILSNVLFEDKNKEINDALRNRMLIVEFFSSLTTDNLNNDFKNKIKDEEASIVIYCNKVFFNMNKEKKKYKNLNNILI